MLLLGTVVIGAHGALFGCDLLANEKGHKIFADAETREAEVEALLLKGLPPDKKARILDFGCGDGLLLGVAQKLGYKDFARA